MTNLQVPIFELGVLHPDVPRHRDRLGGLPSGLPPGAWPMCAQCGAFQTFLAQFALDDERSVLLFQCDSDEATCETWSPAGGANAALVLRRDPLLAPLAGPPSGETKIAPEVLIRSWSDAHPDGMAAYRGGAPRWTSTHAHEPAMGDSFVLQLPDEVELDDLGITAANSGAEIVSTEGREIPPVPCEHYGWWSRGCRNRVGQPSQLVRQASGKCIVAWANFGGGTMYLFMRSDGTAYHFWER
jgi:hypothetical protein